jgi:two-component system chemotaxis response regulator CheY
VQHRSRNYNILVVRDNSRNDLLIRETVAECGTACHITVAETAAAATHLLDSQTFDLLISETGTQTEPTVKMIRAVRSDPRLKSLPVIVLSDSTNSRLAYEAGANAFVEKPANGDSLLAKVRALLHFWLEVVELPRIGETV